MESLQGRLLLASPHLLDPNFVKTVILMIEHNEQGALGVVLNRPTSKTVQELWRQVGEGPCESRRPVYLGGPVSGPLLALHGLAECAEVEIVPGVFFAAKKQNLDPIVHQEGPYKLFVGHSGWGPGQLENELAEGAWLSAPATAAEVFGDDEELWQRISQRLEESLLKSLLKIKHVPPDPRMN